MACLLLHIPFSKMTEVYKLFILQSRPVWRRVVLSLQFTPGEELPPIYTTDQFPRFNVKFADIIFVQISVKRGRNCTSHLLFCLFNLKIPFWSDEEPKATRKIEKKSLAMPFVRERHFWTLRHRSFLAQYRMRPTLSTRDIQTAVKQSK